MRLQAPKHAVAGPITYGCTLHHIRLQALGDVLISATFGPLLVGFSYLAQCSGFPGTTP